MKVIYKKITKRPDIKSKLYWVIYSYICLKLIDQVDRNMDFVTSKTSAVLYFKFRKNESNL